MKCIKMYDQKDGTPLEIVRTTDEKAAQIIREATEKNVNGICIPKPHYTTKEAWKRNGRHYL